MGRYWLKLITRFASSPPSHREVADTDILAALQTLAETYRTQASGIIYEKPLNNPLQRALYEQLKAAIMGFRENGATIGHDHRAR